MADPNKVIIDEQSPREVVKPEAPVQDAASSLRPGEATVMVLNALPDTEARNEAVRALVAAEVERQNQILDYREAQRFADSGQYAELKGLNRTQAIAFAMTKMSMGRSYGMNRAEAMSDLYVVHGRPNLQNNVIASRLYRAGIWGDPKWDYETTTVNGKQERRCIGCTLYLKRWNAAEKKWVPMLDVDGNRVAESFTEADAKKVKVSEGGKETTLDQKAMYKAWAKNMYYWRCIANVRRFYAPDVMHGASFREERFDVPEDVIDVETMEPEPELEPDPRPEAKPEPSLKDRVLEQASLLDPREK